MKTKKQNGFTIIEVVLVLAIAGLIFLMVFVALPALQRSQRDTQRKDDLSRAVTAITNYTSSNRGALPDLSGSGSSFIGQYLATNGDSFIDPSGAQSGSSATTYAFDPHDNTTLSGSFSPTTTQNIIYYTTSASCDAGGAVKAAGTRTIALRMYLEGGGVYCLNN